jgi:hypothetical protein
MKEKHLNSDTFYALFQNNLETTNCILVLPIIQAAEN